MRGRALVRILLGCGLLILAPRLVLAQSGIAGTVRDATGGVLPGRDCRGHERSAHRADALGGD